MKLRKRQTRNANPQLPPQSAVMVNGAAWPTIGSMPPENRTAPPAISPQQLAHMDARTQAIGVMSGSIVQTLPGSPVNQAQAQECAAQSRHVRPLRAIHCVRPGETLPQIAGQYGLTTGELIKMNCHTLGRDGIVYPDMRLQV
jgi:hypothetical protein